MKFKFGCPLLVLIVAAALSSAVGQTKPTTENLEQVNVLSLAQSLNEAVMASDVQGVRRLMYVPEEDYDFAGMQRYFESVAAGKFKDWRFEVLHAEVEGDYAVAIISQEAPDAEAGELTPVAIFKPGVRWRVLPFDLPKDHPEIGGEQAATAYAMLMERAADWVRENTNAQDESKSTSQPAK